MDREEAKQLLNRPYHHAYTEDNIYPFNHNYSSNYYEDAHGFDHPLTAVKPATGATMFYGADARNNIEDRLKHFNPTIGEMGLIHHALGGWSENPSSHGGRYLQAISNQLNGHHPLSSLNTPSLMHNKLAYMQHGNPRYLEQHRKDTKEELNTTNDMLNPEINSYHPRVLDMFGHLQNQSQDLFQKEHPEGEFQYRGIGSSQSKKMKNQFEKNRQNNAFNVLNSYSTDFNFAKGFNSAGADDALISHIQPKDVFLHPDVFGNKEENELVVNQNAKKAPHFISRSTVNENGVPQITLYGHPNHIDTHGSMAANHLRGKYQEALPKEGYDVKPAANPYEQKVQPNVMQFADLVKELKIIQIAKIWNDIEAFANMDDNIIHMPQERKNNLENLDKEMNKEFGIPDDDHDITKGMIHFHTIKPEEPQNKNPE